MELIIPCPNIEQARNHAIKWLESRGAVFGPHRAIVIGKFGALNNRETGVESTVGTFWRLRLDFDPVKKAHFNAEFGRGAAREKAAFTFPGDAALISRLAAARHPR